MSARTRATRARPGLLPAVLLAVLLLGLTACSSGKPEASPSTSSSSSTATSAAPAPPAPPPAHACYDLDFAAAVKATTTEPPVPCSSAHTTTTIRVGTIRPVVDGHLLAVDADPVQQQIAGRCRRALAAQVGGDEETRRLSRLTVVWFSPSLTDSDRGALWFRCDLVALAGHDVLAPLPRVTRGILSQDGALDRWGTCGTASPAASRFERVICSQPHSWRARATVDLPAGAAYLGKAAGAAADSACHDVDAKLAADSLKLHWSFEWPTKDAWNAGQRYGLCWTPDPA
jgi:hypothetical protein